MYFRLTWRDPETGEDVVEEREFEDTGEITAREWAVDYCYTCADKGPYTIKELG